MYYDLDVIKYVPFFVQVNTVYSTFFILTLRSVLVEVIPLDIPVTQHKTVDMRYHRKH
jgi:hypothetical protein